MARVEQFDPADREGMLRRYRELGGTASILGGRQSERLLAELQRLLHRRDYERGRALVADDWVSVDHRAVGWDDYQGRDAWEETTRSFFDASPTARVDVEEVLACDDRVIAARVAWRDRGLKAGDLEVLAGAVHLFEDGRWISVDYYEPDDRRAIIARYVELGGGLAPLGDTPVERLLRHYAERYAARDLEGATATLAEHWRHTDHRQLGWAGLGRDQYRVEQVGVWESTADVRIEVDEVLACDGRVLAAVTTYYGTAAESGGGGRFEYSVGVVTVAEDGVTVMTDWYEPDDREAILARYRELGGRYESVAGHLEPDRFFAEFFDRLHARDYDRISEMVAEEWSWSDHRPLGWEPARGRAECLATMRSLAEGAPGVRIEFDEILAEDDRVLAALMSWRGRGVKAGDLEVTAGVVMVVEQGVWVKADFYDPDDRQAIIARYVELGGGLGRLGDSPPERWLAEWARRYPTADFDGMAALASPRCSFKDHRRLGWDPVQTAEGMAELGRSIWSGTSDVRLEVDEVLACNERAVAARVRVHATSRRHAIRSQTPTGAVILVEDGLLISWDQYDEADRESLMARYAELTALATPVTERWVQAYVNRFNDRDLAGVVELYSEDAELTDRRTFGGAPARGRSAIEEFFASIFDASPDMRGTIDEVIASDERVIAYVNTRRGSATIGGGPAALSMGLVQVWDDGLIISSDLYEPDDRQAMIARYAELGGGTSKLGDRAPELFWRQVAEVFAARDLERMAELVDENYRIHDHRAMAWDSIADRAQFMQLIESTFAVSRDMHLEVREVLACDDRVIALRASYRGHAVEGAGEIEVPLGYVSIVRDGQAISLDQYDADDTEAMLSRFRELTALRTAASSDPAPAPGTPSPAAADARPPASPA
jgi:ketosteroid isomerase-like protein